MLIYVILIVYSFCNTATSKDITPTHQIRIRFSQPAMPVYSYPYQEDLTSSIQFLKEETPNKEQKVGGLIKLLKKVLTKYIDVLKGNEEKSKCNMVDVQKSQEVKKEEVKEHNTIVKKTEHAVVKEFQRDREVVREVKTGKMIDEVHEIHNKTIDSQNSDNVIMTNIPEEKIENDVILLKNLVDEGPLNYMQFFTPRPTHYQNQQDPYVLERPEPHIVQSFDPIVENIVRNKIIERRPDIARISYQENDTKKQPFFLPYVKASDILNETPKYVPKDYCTETPLKDSNSQIFEDVQSTLEAPATNYITCSESDDTVAMLFKPKTISLMQAYGNLLKKITVTVLVPFHVTKLVV